MIRKTFCVLMALAAMTTLGSCEEEDLEKVYDEATSLDAPFLFSEGYEDTIAIAYDLLSRLSVGLNTGLTGAGLDVAMAVHPLVTVRTGFAGWDVVDIKFKAINTATEIT